MDDFIDDMSYTPQTNATSHQQVDSAPSNSISMSTKRKSKDKLLDHMYSMIRTIAESVAELVPKIDGLISIFSSDKDIADLQGKLYGEMSRIEGLADEEIYDATSTLASKHDLLYMFFTLPHHHKKGYVIQMLHHRV